eukprot:jgi/Bigna1/140732/aug1.58_g15440
MKLTKIAVFARRVSTGALRGKLDRTEGMALGTVNISWIGNSEFKVAYGSKTTLSMMKKKLARLTDIPEEEATVIGYSLIEDEYEPESEDYIRECLVLDLDHTLIDVGPGSNYTAITKQPLNASDDDSMTYIESDELKDMGSEEIVRRLHLDEPPLPKLVEGHPGFSIRPGLHKLLTKVYQGYDIFLWSGATMGWMYNNSMDAAILHHPDFKITGLLDYQSMLTINSSRYGRFATKPLQILWRYSNGCYNASNTILVDDMRSCLTMAVWIIRHLGEYLIALSVAKSFGETDHRKYVKRREQAQIREAEIRQDRLRKEAQKEADKIALEENMKNAEREKKKEIALRKLHRIVTYGKKLREGSISSTETEDRDSDKERERKKKDLLTPFDPIASLREVQELNRKNKLKHERLRNERGYYSGFVGASEPLFWEGDEENDEGSGDKEGGRVNQKKQLDDRLQETNHPRQQEDSRPARDEERSVDGDWKDSTNPARVDKRKSPLFVTSQKSRRWL